MWKPLRNAFYALAAYGLFVALCATPAHAMWDFDRHWVGHQRPSGGDTRDRGDGRDADDEDQAEKAKEERYNDLNNQEHTAFAQKNYQEALRLALERQGLWDGPKVRANIAFYRGLIADERGDYDAAVAFLQEAAASNSFYAEYANTRQREVSAWKTNEKGREAYARQDWAAAADYFQQALKSFPNEPAYQNNVALASYQLGTEAISQKDYTAAVKYLEKALAIKPAGNDSAPKPELIKEFLEEARLELDKSRQNEFAVTAIQQDLQRFNAGKKDPAMHPVDLTAARRTSKGLFGTDNSAPDLQFGDPDAGTKKVGTNPGDQLQSAVQDGSVAKKALPPEGSHSEAFEFSDEKAKKGFDTAGEDQGHLATPAVESPTPTTEMPVIPKEMANDPVIRESMEHLNTWNKELQQANAEVNKAEAAVKQAGEPLAKARAEESLKEAQGKSDTLRLSVETAKKDVAARKDYLRKVYLAPINVQPAPVKKPSAEPPLPLGTVPAQQPGS